MWAQNKGVAMNSIVVLFTAFAPHPIADGLSRAGFCVYEALAVSEVLALAAEHPEAQIVITAEIEPDRAKVIQEHYPTLHLSQNARVEEIIWELSAQTNDTAVQ
jgi:hypothetical protein